MASLPPTDDQAGQTNPSHHEQPPSPVTNSASCNEKGEAVSHHEQEEPPTGGMKADDEKSGGRGGGDDAPAEATTTGILLSSDHNPVPNPTLQKQEPTDQAGRDGDVEQSSEPTPSSAAGTIGGSNDGGGGLLTARDHPTTTMMTEEGNNDVAAAARLVEEADVVGPELLAATTVIMGGGHGPSSPTTIAQTISTRTTDTPPTTTAMILTTPPPSFPWDWVVHDDSMAGRYEAKQQLDHGAALLLNLEAGFSRGGSAPFPPDFELGLDLTNTMSFTTAFDEALGTEAPDISTMATTPASRFPQQASELRGQSSPPVATSTVSSPTVLMDLDLPTSNPIADEAFNSFMTTPPHQHPASSPLAPWPSVVMMDVSPTTTGQALKASSSPTKAPATGGVLEARSIGVEDERASISSHHGAATGGRPEPKAARPLTPPPPPPRRPPPNIRTLNPKIYAAINLFLSTQDTLKLTEASKWVLRTFAGQIKEVVVRFVDYKTRRSGVTMLQRRTNVERVVVKDYICAASLSEAIQSKRCRKIKDLEMGITGSFGLFSEIPSLYQLIAMGSFPHLKRLCLSGISTHDDPTLPAKIGQALNGMTIAFEHSPLQALEIRSPAFSDLGEVLASGGCIDLEELRLSDCQLVDQSAVYGWLRSARAHHLRIFTLKDISPHTASQLAWPGITPRLQVLHLPGIDSPSLEHLAVGFRTGVWEDLQELRLTPQSSSQQPAVRSLMEALCVGGSSTVRVLGLTGAEVGPEGAATVTQALGRGACPWLEELDLSNSKMGDGGVIGLAEMMLKSGGGGDGPLASSSSCCGTLRRLNLSGCGVGVEGIKALMETLCGGGSGGSGGSTCPCPHLEYLNLDGNEEVGDRGIDYLAQAIKSRGALQQLQEVHIEHTGLHCQGLLSLFEALLSVDDSGHYPCPALFRVCVRGNGGGGGGDRTSMMKEAMNALDAQRGHGKVKVEWD